MPGKRSKRKQVQHFHCPYCELRLWRMPGSKYFLFYLQASEIKASTNVSRKTALLLANQGIYTDNNAWIEEFLCREHGTSWMKVIRKTDGTLVARLAKSEDWQNTTRTIRPDTPNPSVGEFTYRMSRQTGQKLMYAKE